MDILYYLIDFVLHIDQHLVQLVQDYEQWIYLILFVIVFCETGLVVTPFLPGDSLLFALGALTAIPASGLNLLLVMALLIVAAILGDSFNYYVGSKIGSRIYLRDFWFLRRTHIDQTQRFYEKYGGRTIIYARFVPIIRTFAPFVAGVGKMNYRRFFSFNVVGALMWVVFFMLMGYLFGNLPAVKRHFSLLILAIIVLSMAPPVVAALKNWLSKKSPPQIKQNN
ncbi:DedA family protein [Pontibacter ramchanderi]|uniref:Membrane-associated protein n=1 Tax=Pontibacter ramchanderi TaxID=1179743 RepID=A0A2N3V0J5_9BACT|nr:DedA family protein [Pontibacter ramchanderi]PKV75147.1 membrane-associated protein [Pontibacter ramchanderi]